MSNDAFSVNDSEQGSRPPVGIVATGDNDAAVLADLFRAYQDDRRILLTCTDRYSSDIVGFAEDLGATVIESPVTEDERQVRTAESSAVREEETTDARSDAPVRLPPTSDESSTASDVAASGPNVLVAIPAYNEVSTIAEVVGETQDVCDQVCVIDDGSDDETALRAASAGASVVQHDRNKGYGAALHSAFKEAARLDAEQLVVIDADGQHDPRDIPTLVERRRSEGADVVIGSRYGDGASSDIPVYRRIGLFAINALTNLCLGVVRSESRISDTQSGFRVYSNRAINELAESNAIGAGMDASIDVLYHAHHNDYHIVEEATRIDYDVEDASTMSPVSHGFVLVQNLLRTIERERPMTVLGIPGIAIVLCGLGVGYLTAMQYSTSGTFPLGLATIATFLVLIGFLASFTGLILHALNVHFEHMA